MKKIVTILGVSALLLGFTSCEDWLDMPSESKADSSSIFSTIGRAEMTVVAPYAKLHTQELGYQMLMGTDETSSTESNSKYNVSNYDYTNLTSILSKTYTEMYAAIEYANVCIKNLPNMAASSEAEQKKINSLLGESLAVRAYAYWNLVRFYGDVPFAEVPTSELTTFSSSRVSRDTIYDHCIADLQRAVELLPWKSEGIVPTTERFTKNAAYGILARVALYAAGHSLRWNLDVVPYDASTVKIAQRSDVNRIKELYQIAADACKAVIDKGENSLVSNYDQLFRDLALNQFNDETMLEFGWYGANSPDVRTGYTNGIPTGGESLTLGKGGSQMMAMPTFYFEYEEGDQRRDVSICNYGLNLVKSENADTYQMNTYMGMGVGKYRINWKSEIGSSSSRRDINWPLLRYSDVLLMYAEALNELNNGANATAVNAVKEVRMRAFKNDASKVGEIPTGYAEFRDFIIQERKLELAHEGLRKTDLCRWGILVDYLNAEKDKLYQLARREGRYADVDVYRAYKLTSIPSLKDPNIALDYISVSEDDLAAMNLSEADMNTLNVLNDSKKGFLEKNLYEDAEGNVYFAQSQAPVGVELKEVKYTILNMFGIHSIKNKGGGLCVDDVEGFATANTWITGSTGVFYGMQKNMVEIMPFHQTAIIDVNPGLADQQHPCY